ncbi:MAG: ABC transporter substrate-binding protein [Methylomicrobium sp.]
MAKIRQPLQAIALSSSSTDRGRRNFLRLSAVSLTALVNANLVACQADTPLRVALQPWCGYQFLFLAQREGLLESESIELVPTTLARDSMELLQQGRVQAAALTLDEILRLRDIGVPVSLVMIFDISAGADVLLAKPDIKRLADLKGRRIGLENSGLAKILLAKLIERAQLNPGDLNIEIIDFDHVNAWRNNSLDAILTYEPHLSQLQKLGLRPIFDSRHAPQLIVDALAVRTDLIQSYRVALRHLLKAHFSVLHLWRTNPIDTSYRLSALLGVEPDRVHVIFKGLDLPDALYNLEYLTPPAEQLTKTVQTIGSILLHQGLIERPVDSEGLFVPDFLPGETVR